MMNEHGRFVKSVLLPPLTNGRHTGRIFVNRRQQVIPRETLVTVPESRISGKGLRLVTKLTPSPGSVVAPHRAAARSKAVATHLLRLVPAFLAAPASVL